MKTQSIKALSAKKLMPRSSPTQPDDAAVEMAQKFELVFEHAWNLSIPNIEAMIVDARKRAIFTMSHLNVPTLNRDAAAFWANQRLPATTLDEWFDATGLEKKKDLFVALQVSPSTLSRAKPDTTLDAAVTERMLRQSELFVRAAEVFGEDGSVWMTKPHDLLGGKAPVEYASNEFGGAKVRQILNAIEYGGVV